MYRAERAAVAAATAILLSFSFLFFQSEYEKADLDVFQLLKKQVRRKKGIINCLRFSRASISKESLLFRRYNNGKEWNGANSRSSASIEGVCGPQTP